MSEIIKEMVQEAPNQVSNLDKSISQLDSQISNLNSKLNAIKDDVMTPESVKLSDYLNSKYQHPEYFFKTGSKYNDSMSTDGSITDWFVCTQVFNNYEPNSDHYIFESNTTIKCLDDKTSQFTEGKDVVFSSFDGTSYTNIEFSNVISSTFDSTNSVTEIIFVDPIIVDNMGILSISTISYSNGEDLEIDKHVSNWNFCHDYIHKPLSLDGTYGLKDMKEKLTSSKEMLNINKDKISDSVTVFNEYIG